MHLLLLLLAPLFSSAIYASGEPSTRKRLFNELQDKLAASSAQSTTSKPQTRATSTAASQASAVKPSVAKVERPQQASVVTRQEDIRSTAVSSTSNRDRAVTDPQERLRSDIIGVLMALYPSIDSQSARRIANYHSTDISREEKKKSQLEDFTGRLTSSVTQLAHIKALIDQKPLAHNFVQLAGGPHMCCGKSVDRVVDLATEIEKAVLSQKWGRVIKFGDVRPLENLSYHVNEDFIAGSWVAFLDARLAELELTRSTQTFIQKSATQILPNLLNKRILLLRDLCQFLRESALNKHIGDEYREVFQEIIEPITAVSAESAAETSTTKKRRVQE